MSKAPTLKASGFFDFMEEIWKDVIGYEGIYQISNVPQIRSLARQIDNNRGGLTTLKGKILKASWPKNGYKSYTLSKDGKCKTFFEHRLVALHFIPFRKGCLHINHIDGNKLNNHFKNLEWCTPRENIKHAYKKGLRLSPCDRASKLTREDIIEIRKRVLLQGKVNHPAELAKEFGVCRDTITSIKYRRSWNDM